MKDVDIQKLIDYHCQAYLMDGNTFQQVYEEITTFAFWLKGFQPHNILEVGFKGVTFHIFSQLSTGKKVAVDIDDDWRRTVSHFMMYDEEFKFFQGNSQSIEMREKVQEFCPKYDLIFIDGDHSYDGVRKDFELYKGLLSDRGYVVFHDIDPDHVFADNYGGQVYKFWEELNYGVKTNIVTTRSSGKVSTHGQSEHFGGIGLWRPQ